MMAASSPGAPARDAAHRDHALLDRTASSQRSPPRLRISRPACPMPAAPVRATAGKIAGSALDPPPATVDQARVEVGRAVRAHLVASRTWWKLVGGVISGCPEAPIGGYYRQGDHAVTEDTQTSSSALLVSDGAFDPLEAGCGNGCAISSRRSSKRSCRPRSAAADMSALARVGPPSRPWHAAVTARWRRDGEGAAGAHDR